MLMEKYQGNPIVTIEQVPFRANSIFNPGATRYGNEYLLLCRVEMPNGRSSFLIERSKDGINFVPDSRPCLTPEDHGEFFKYAEWGIEDPRIVKLGVSYYITYTGYSKYMPLVMLAETKDFIKFNVLGPISEPSNKDCALFPEKINGLYWKMDRPSADKSHNIWISSSPDLIHWGQYKILMEPTTGTWENDKIGGSTPPVKTKDGWLLCYHGVRGFGISTLYKIGAVLLDLHEPWKVIGKTAEPVLMPEKDYERTGDVNNVVFANGWIVEDDGTVRLYYSGADTNICLATTTTEELIKACKG